MGAGARLTFLPMAKKIDRSHALFFLIILAAFLVVLAFLYRSRISNFKSFVIGQRSIQVEIADTEAKRSQGLSGRKLLSENQGMLFVFPYTGIYPFWMKDMHFPLDFVWISQKKVVDITENVPNPKTPTDQLPLYTPKEPVDMVLEVNAGFIKKNNIKIGDTIEYKP